ncbi:hypothetical protein [Acinetobacter guillouiae]|uniref:hypothetical protein n=1 Tax=Acinetobacter guillouiae TaxID=106649 RepID=UPI00300B3D1A
MQKINKQNEPVILTTFKQVNPHANYSKLTYAERQAIRQSCTIEQYYLCAYCCQEITGERIDTINEHMEAQTVAPNRTLDFNNIVASCRTIGQCDSSHKSQIFSLTPLMGECESELKFKISGRVEGLTPRAIEAINVLNLGDTEVKNNALIEKRKQLSLNMLISCGIDHTDMVEDDELLESVAVDLLQPKNGKLEPFAPVVANIIRGWITS